MVQEHLNGKILNIHNQRVILVFNWNWMKNNPVLKKILHEIILLENTYLHLIYLAFTKCKSSGENFKIAGLGGSIFTQKERIIRIVVHTGFYSLLVLVD